MKPKKVGRHVMTLSQWQKFKEQASDWLLVINIDSLPYALQTTIAESLLDTTLAKQARMHLKEKHSRNFHSASLILAAAGGKRDKELHPKIVRVWCFFQKYITSSETLDWSSEPACRAITREIKDAAFSCGIHSALKTPDNWAYMVTSMSMDDFHQYKRKRNLLLLIFLE